MGQETDNVLDLKAGRNGESYLARMERSRKNRNSFTQKSKINRNTSEKNSQAQKEDRVSLQSNKPLPKRPTPGKDYEEGEQEEFSQNPQTKKAPKKNFLGSARAGVQRVGNSTAFLMLALALFYDFLQFILNLIPFLGNILSSILIGPFAWLSFYVWFKIKGVSFAKPKRSLTLTGAGVLEMIPILNALPAWTLAVLVLIATTKFEDTAQSRQNKEKSSSYVSQR